MFTRRVDFVKMLIFQVRRAGAKLRIPFSAGHLQVTVFDPFYDPPESAIALQVSSAQAESTQRGVQVRERFFRDRFDRVTVQRQQRYRWVRLERVVRYFRDKIETEIQYPELRQSANGRRRILGEQIVEQTQRAEGVFDAVERILS